MTRTPSSPLLHPRYREPRIHTTPRLGKSPRTTPRRLSENSSNAQSKRHPSSPPRHVGTWVFHPSPPAPDKLQVIARGHDSFWPGDGGGSESCRQGSMSPLLVVSCPLYLIMLNPDGLSCWRITEMWARVGTHVTPPLPFCWRRHFRVRGVLGQGSGGGERGGGRVCWLIIGSFGPPRRLVGWGLCQCGYVDTDVTAALFLIVREEGWQGGPC